MPSEQAPPPPKSVPGWYPDPAVGHGLQRYFDGTSWTSEWAFAAEPPKKGTSRKAAVALAALCTLVLLVFIGKSWVFDPKKDSTSSPSSSSETQRPPTPTEEVPSTPAGPKKPSGVTFTIAPGPNGRVDARFAIRDNYTEQMIKDGARSDTIDILKYANATYPDASAVNVQGTFPMTDPYGNTSTQVAIDLLYSRETLNKINFDGVTTKTIWEIRDSGTLLPAFQP